MVYFSTCCKLCISAFPLKILKFSTQNETEEKYFLPQIQLEVDNISSIQAVFIGDWEKKHAITHKIS